MSEEYSNMECQCGEPLELDFEVCPNCGRSVSLSCPNCQKPVKPNWKICPWCQIPLSGEADDIAEELEDTIFGSDTLEEDDPPLLEPAEILEKLNDAITYYNGTGGDVDYAMAKELFLELAEFGDPLGKMWVALCHYKGCCNFQKDTEKAQEIANEVIEQIRQLSNEGNHNTTFLLGCAYENGLGLNQDYEKAAELYRMAIEAGNSDAMNHLGVMYQNGLGVAKDHKRAWELYRKASRAENRLAAEKLNFMYKNKLGIPKDYATKAEWYRGAAEAGSDSAMLDLGFLYVKGLGVKQDYGEAAEWHRKAAEAGNTVAMTGLGMMYEKGTGVAQDYAEALKWHRKAAIFGESTSMFALGMLYEHGLGVDKNRSAATEWYQRATEAGCKPAAKALGFKYRCTLGLLNKLEKLLGPFGKAVGLGIKIILIALVLGGIGLGGYRFWQWLSGPVWFWCLWAARGDQLWNITTLVSSAIIMIGWIASVVRGGFFSHYDWRLKLGGTIVVPLAIHLPYIIISSIIMVVLESWLGWKEPMAMVTACAIYLGFAVIIMLLGIFVRGYE